MKKIFILLILFATLVNAQDFMQSLSNNRFTLLGSSVTYTGTWETNHGMGYLTLVMRANKNSAALGVKIQFSQRGTTIDHEYQFTYTANDTITNTKPVPVAGNYFRIVYTNTNDAQTGLFYLTTYLHRNSVLPLDANGNLLVTTSVIVPGVSTSSNQTTQIARADSLALLTKLIYYRLFGEATAIRQDTLNNNIKNLYYRLNAIKIANFPSGQTYADVRNSWDWARSFTTYTDSVRTDSATIVKSRDTIIIGGSEWSKVHIRGVASTDSLYFGVGTTAPSIWHKIIGSTEFITEKLNKTYFTKVFIKGYGAYDSIKSYEVTIEAF